VLFADDEQMARKRMRRLLEAIEGVTVVAECESGEAAMRALDTIDVDVALLDVHMGALSGLDVSRVAEELGVEVIFTTAHEAHAVEAFARGAVDYVLKPIEAERLAQAIERARKRMPVRVASSTAPLDRIALEVRGEVRLVRPADVTHAIHDGRLATVFVGGEALLSEKSLAELEASLPALERVHRRALLSLAHVERLRPQDSGGYVAVVAGGAEVPVSRQAARGLRRRLGIG
jgi:two-component system LytT family response regulator